jgi:hypothetical protein
MMVDGAEESQLRGPIDVLAPYTSLPQHLHPFCLYVSSTDGYESRLPALSRS